MSMWKDSLVKSFEGIETPFYYYDMEVLNENLNRLRAASEKFNYKVHYAFKANTNTKIVSAIRDHGFGADCVSGNEVQYALDNGFSTKSITFAGVGKSDAEIALGIDANIFCFNVESIQELEVINEISKKKNKVTSVAIRINPNFSANTHEFITTGTEDNKFGVSHRDFEKLMEAYANLENVRIDGLHFHIGSQITDMEVFKGLTEKVNQIIEWFYSKGMKFGHLNLGGGLGVNYENPDEDSTTDFESYFQVFADYLQIDSDVEIHFELGRSLVADCGSLISRVLYIKPSENTNFAIIDAGMTELIRPALYRAQHKIENIVSKGVEINYDVVGPICESSDFFGKKLMMPETKRGDFIAVRSTGAYGEVMASRYNMRTPAKAYYSDELQ